MNLDLIRKLIDIKIVRLFLIVNLIFIYTNCTKSEDNMGIFDKLFGKNEQQSNTRSSLIDISHLEKTSKMLDEDLYWEIIDKSLKNTSNQDEQEKYLIAEISKLNLHEIIGFKLRTEELHSDTYTSEMWCAAYVLRGGCGDDSFDYFLYWLISRGKNAYYKTQNNPDDLIDFVIEGEEDYDFESFSYIPIDVFEKKTGKELYDYVEYELDSKESGRPDIDFNWNDEDPESMKKICPRLFERFLE